MKLKLAVASIAALAVGIDEPIFAVPGIPNLVEVDRDTLESSVTSQFGPDTKFYALEAGDDFFRLRPGHHTNLLDGVSFERPADKDGKGQIAIVAVNAATNQATGASFISTKILGNGPAVKYGYDDNGDDVLMEDQDQSIPHAFFTVRSQRDRETGNLALFLNNNVLGAISLQLIASAQSPEAAAKAIAKSQEVNPQDAGKYFEDPETLAPSGLTKKLFRQFHERGVKTSRPTKVSQDGVMVDKISTYISPIGSQSLQAYRPLVASMAQTWGQTKHKVRNVTTGVTEEILHFATPVTNSSTSRSSTGLSNLPNFDPQQVPVSQLD